MNAQLSVTELLDNASRLETGEFDVFFREMLSLRAKRVASVLPLKESDLLQKIYLKLPAHIQQRYDSLTAKRQDETILPEEYAELMELVPLVEKHNVQRLKYIVELSQLRNLTPQELMKQLGLMPLHNA